MLMLPEERSIIRKRLRTRDDFPLQTDQSHHYSLLRVRFTFQYDPQQQLSPLVLSKVRVC